MLTWEYQLLPLAKRKVSPSFFVNEWQHNGWICTHNHLLQDQATVEWLPRMSNVWPSSEFPYFCKLSLFVITKSTKMLHIIEHFSFQLTLWTVSRIKAARSFRTVHYRSTWALIPVKGSSLLHSCLPCGIPTQSQTPIHIRSAAKLLT